MQSNHCRLTLAAAIREGLPCQLVLEERVPKSYDYHASGNNFLFNLMKPEKIHIAPFGTSPVQVMEEVAEQLREEGRHPYIIPVGGSNAVGDLGYVACANEILAQMKQMGIRFDRIFVTSGSAGSHAGLLAGMKANQESIEVHGIGINRPQKVQEAAVLELANDTLQKLGLAPTITENDVVVNCNYIGEGYSLPTEAMKRAVRLVAEQEAIILDPTYTGKTMSGLIDLIEKGIIGKEESGGGRKLEEGILTWRGFGCDQEGSWSGAEQAIALWCCEAPKVLRDDYRTIFGLGSMRLRISRLESNHRNDIESEPLFV